MNRKLFIFTIIMMGVLVGCGNIATPSVSPDADREKISSRYNQYLKKIWLMNQDANDSLGGGYMSIRINKIDDEGKLEGEIYSDGYETYTDERTIDNAVFTGRIVDNTAYCEFKDSDGKEETLKIIFSKDDKILINTSFFIQKKDKKHNNTDNKVNLSEIEFEPDNINNYNFKIIKNQSMLVDIDSWGLVQFVVGEFLGGPHGSVLSLYLTNENGDILYDFYHEDVCDLDSKLLYAERIKEYSFEDVNMDGLKDLIIIAIVKKHYRKSIASVYLQDSNGNFTNNAKLEKKINNSVNHKDVENVREYLYKQFQEIK